MLTALLIFPCAAVLWLLLCDRLGQVEDGPPSEHDLPAQHRRRRAAADRRPPLGAATDAQASRSSDSRVRNQA